MSCIVGHKRDGSALGTEDAYIKIKSGKLKQRQTTVGWTFHIKWKDGSMNWVPLSTLKESNPVDIADYVVARGLEKEPAFAWWVPYTLRKRDVIVLSINSRVRKRTHKYGIAVPTSFTDAMRLDRENGDTLWADAHAD